VGETWFVMGPVRNARTDPQLRLFRAANTAHQFQGDRGGQGVNERVVMSFSNRLWGAWAMWLPVSIKLASGKTTVVPAAFLSGNLQPHAQHAGVQNQHFVRHG
jgi:hypothetical protein